MLALILAASFAIRLIAVVPVHSKGMTSDEKEFLLLAHQLIDGRGFVDSNGDRSVRAPLFPALVALAMGGFGTPLAQLFVWGCLLGTLVVYLGSLLSLKVWHDETVALATACLLGLYPGLVIYSALLQTETLYIVFFLWALVLFYQANDRSATGTMIALGCAAGLATLTRAVFIGFFPLLLASLWMMWRKKGKGDLRSLMIAFVVFCVILAPWTVRNSVVHGAFVPVSTVTGSSLLIGNNPFSHGTPELPPEYTAWVHARARDHGIDNIEALPELERSALMRDIALEYMRSHPMQVVLLAARKAFVLWVYPVTQTATDHAIQAVAVGADVVVLLFVAIGLVASFRHRWRLLPICSAAVFFTLVQIVMHAEARYRLPLIPLLGLIGGFGFIVATRSERRQEALSTHGSRVALGFLLGGIALVYGYTGWLFFHGVV